METTMTPADRELLELAAKAFWADDEVSIRFDENEDGLIYTHADNQDHNGQDFERVWNPRDDDGDCARLEAALLIDVEWTYPRGRVYCSPPLKSSVPRVTENAADHNNDLQAARRMASLRAAAEVGRAMP